MNNTNRKHIVTLLVVVLLQITSLHAQSVTDNAIVSFVYHRFGENKYPSTNISVDEFRNHLRYLKDNNYNVLTLGNALDLLQNGEGVPDKTVVLTIDDGYSSFNDKAMPLLRQFGYKATLFINTGQVGYKGFISWDEIKELVNDGIEIGNHSHSHDYFLNNRQDDVLSVFRDDLERSQQIFMKELGFVPSLFSYPFGEYTHAMKNELKNQGLKAAVAQNSGVISGFSDIYALPRFPLTGIFSSAEKFIERVNMKALPVVTESLVDPVLSGKNPPILRLRLKKPELINSVNLQCFVGGLKNCSIDYDSTDNIIAIQSKQPLNKRRTLYTVTAPSAINSNRWYWFSYLWVNKAAN